MQVKLPIVQDHVCTVRVCNERLLLSHDEAKKLFKLYLLRLATLIVLVTALSGFAAFAFAQSSNERIWSEQRLHDKQSIDIATNTYQIENSKLEITLLRAQVVTLQDQAAMTRGALFAIGGLLTILQIAQMVVGRGGKPPSQLIP